jgi:thioredoxin reductase
MTFKDLRKLVRSQSSPEQYRLLQQLIDKPFWIWNQQQHGHTWIFAAGDVRSGSVERVASGVGEGSIAIQFIHQYLKKVQ